MSVRYFTDAQLRIEKWINQMGFLTELEKPYGYFCVDIWIPEINWGVECDGPDHYKTKDKKRDDYLKESFGITTIIHVSNNITREQLEQVFVDNLEREFGKDKNGTNGIEKGN